MWLNGTRHAKDFAAFADINFQIHDLVAITIELGPLLCALFDRICEVADYRNDASVEFGQSSDVNRNLGWYLQSRGLRKGHLLDLGDIIRVILVAEVNPAGAGHLAAEEGGVDGLS